MDVDVNILVREVRALVRGRELYIDAWVQRMEACESRHQPANCKSRHQTQAKALGLRLTCDFHQRAVDPQKNSSAVRVMLR